MIIGKVQQITVDEAYAQGYEKRYGKDGFMMLIPAPQNLISGAPSQQYAWNGLTEEDASKKTAL